MTLDELRVRLAGYVAQRCPEQPVGSLGPLAELAGGWASSLYTFTLGRAGSSNADATTVVLKMYAPNAHGCAHAMREWRALTHLRAVNYPAPRGILVEPDARHLGHPFLLMDHIPGASFWHVHEAADPSARAQLTQLFAGRLSALHALDPHLLEPAATPARPYAYIEKELEHLRRDSVNSPHPMLAEVIRWLERRERAVPCERPAILHRDYHPWNVVVDAAEQLWVIDWDWQIGDARFDLAWTCTLMQRSDFHAFGDAVRDAYAAQSDHSVDDLAYFEVLTTVRWLLNVLPSAESSAPQRADFRAFLVDPVRRAQTFLQERTGIDPRIRM